MKETALIIVNRMNIASKERIIKIKDLFHRLFFNSEKRIVMKMLTVLKWKVMHIAHVTLDFLVMVKNIAFQHVVLVIGRMNSLENAITSTSVLK